jgi:glycosyltransferase involved in cell wall biosynthesis
MRIVIDGLPIRSTSLAIVVEQLLAGWQRLDEDDDIHLVVGADAALTVPATTTIHRLTFGRRHAIGRLRAQNVRLPRLCRSLRADVVLAPLPTTAISPLPCPRAIIAHDLRHELRPDQFPPMARQLRRVSYGIGFRQADAVICVSERTRGDLLRSRPWLGQRVVRVALHGADHVLSWGAPPPHDPHGYAIAFGQYENKNVELVIDAWAVLKHRGSSMPLLLVGLPDRARPAAKDQVRTLGLEDRLTILPWLPSEAFRLHFLSARLVVFPSDFEGFGLPAIEAMRLGIPVVITPDPALLEITGGHGTIVNGRGPAALAAAVVAADELGPEALDAARVHAAAFTWERSARAVRGALAEVVTGPHRGPPLGGHL